MAPPTNSRKRKLSGEGKAEDDATNNEPAKVLRRSARNVKKIDSNAMIASTTRVVAIKEEEADYPTPFSEEADGPLMGKAGSRKIVAAKGKTTTASKKKQKTQPAAKPKAEVKPAQKKQSPPPKKKSQKGKIWPDGRLREFRQDPPPRFAIQHHRATTERMYVVGRERTGTSEAPAEHFKLAGTTGNVYTVKIDQVVDCNCPQAIFRGGFCKHVIYVMCVVLHAPSELVYQAGLIPSELQTIFDNAPSPPEAKVLVESNDGKRRSISEDEECAICYMEFEADKEATTYCRAGCGNNFHEPCFQAWARTKQATGAPVTCPLCRSVWKAAEEGSQGNQASLGLPNEDEVRQALAEGARGKDGYVNIGGVLGLSPKRDTSTYRRAPDWLPKK